MTLARSLIHDHDPNAAYVMDAGLALSQRQRWEHLFHAELIGAFSAQDDPSALVASLLPDWITTRAERALARLTTTLPDWAAGFIRHKSYPDPDNVGAMAHQSPPVTATQIADALAPTLATAAFSRHVMVLLATRGVPGKQWVTRHDARVRDSHAAADGQVRPLSAPFVVGGALMQYPADASTAPIEQWINDRCVIIGATL